MTTNRKTGIAITPAAAVVACVGLFTGHFSNSFAAGLALGILIGGGATQVRLSRTPDAGLTIVGRSELK